MFQGSHLILWYCHLPTWKLVNKNICSVGTLLDRVAELLVAGFE